VLQQLFATMRAQGQLPEAEEAGPLLDPATTLFAGDLAIVGAPTVFEAETILLTIAVDQASTRDVLIVVDDPDRIDLRILSLATDISVDSIKSGRLTETQLHALNTARERIGSQPLELMRTARMRNNMCDIQRWLENHPNGLAVIPSAWPTSLVEAPEQAAGLVRTLKTLARETEATIAIPWWLRAGTNRDAQLDDLSNAGAAEGDTDLVVLVGHDMMGDVDEVSIAKNRHGECRVLWRAGDPIKLLPGPLDVP
jgi:hypothetical protein